MFITNLFIIKCIALLALVSLVCADSCATITQTTSSTWRNGADDYTQVNVQISAVSSTVSAITFTAAFPSGVSSFDSIWNVQTGATYSLPSYVWSNGGIKQNAPYTFGYIIKSKQYATWAIASSSCGSSTSTTSGPIPTHPPTPKPTTPATVKPTTAPTTKPTSAPTVRPTSAPINPTTAPTTAPASTPAPSKTCDVVFVIDRYIVNSGQSIDSLRAKYLSYFADTQKFFANSFNMELTVSQMYFETQSSFSDNTDPSGLLDDFRSALLNNAFSGLNQGACMYHLITGRQPYATGGLSWIGTACNNEQGYNNGYTVDNQASDDATTVVRRMTHEMGHTFGGEHYDYYTSNPAYTCNNGDSNPGPRVLKRAVNYQYLSEDMFFSQCATNTIINSLSAYSCLWKKNSAAAIASFPTATFYEGSNSAGNRLSVPSFIGTRGCYNIAYPYYGIVNSFTAPASAKGIKFFSALDCTGSSFSVLGTSANVPSANVPNTVSYQYIL